MNLPANNRETVILELANNDQEIFTIIHEAIATHGLTSQAYAAVFRYLCGDSRSANNRLVYMAGSKTWKQGAKTLTDAMVLKELFRVDQMIREYVLLSWENCVFSTWLPARELQHAEKAMDALESLDKLKETLDLASGEMKFTAMGRTSCPTADPEPESEPQINWQEPDDDDYQDGEE